MQKSDSTTIENSLFTVVIPTMWKSTHSRNLLEALDSCKSVGEIFIIDNNPALTPDYLKNLNKATLYSSGVNEYVNPSWNMGVRQAKHELVALCNDDIVFNTDILNTINISDDTLIGLDTSCYKLSEDAAETWLQPTRTRCYGFGCLMLFKKKDYVVIPEQLKVWYGDDYLLANFKHVYTLHGLAVKTNMSTTSAKPEFNEIIQQDTRNYRDLPQPK